MFAWRWFLKEVLARPLIFVSATIVYSLALGMVFLAISLITVQDQNIIRALERSEYDIESQGSITRTQIEKFRANHDITHVAPWYSTTWIHVIVESRGRRIPISEPEQALTVTLFEDINDLNFYPRTPKAERIGILNRVSNKVKPASISYVLAKKYNAGIGDIISIDYSNGRKNLKRDYEIVAIEPYIGTRDIYVEGDRNLWKWLTANTDTKYTGFTLKLQKGISTSSFLKKHPSLEAETKEEIVSNTKEISKNYILSEKEGETRAIRFFSFIFAIAVFSLQYRLFTPRRKAFLVMGAFGVSAKKLALSLLIESIIVLILVICLGTIAGYIIISHILGVFFPLDLLGLFIWRLVAIGSAVVLSASLLFASRSIPRRGLLEKLARN
mgnify:CR=1 FL=1